jgi:serine protease Do
MPIESFIQTDAAVNRGNSGGALADVDGRLIGINTAIVSPSGTFAGYSFAIPSNIVVKVVADLKAHGIVQRALLGISIVSMNAEIADELGVDVVEGVYVAGVSAGSGADDAGITKDDIILSIDGKPVKDVASLQEQVANHSPGDQVNVTLLRNGNSKKIAAVLKNKNNTTAILEKNAPVMITSLGAEFADISEGDKKELGIENGVRIRKIHDGLIQRAEIKEGFVITRLGQRQIKNVADLANALNNRKGGIMLEGVYPNDNEVHYYAFGLDG